MNEIQTLRTPEEYASYGDPTPVVEFYLSDLGIVDEQAPAIGNRALDGARFMLADPDLHVTHIPPASKEDAYPTVKLVQKYLNDIGKHPLLNAEEEIDLAKKMEAGVLAQERLDSTALMMHDHYKRDLATIAEMGEQAKQQMINANLRLVVSIAKRYQTTNAPLLDLIQEGNLGLMHAVEMFDYTKGYKFSTYATGWIRNRVMRHRNEQSTPIMYSLGKYSEQHKVLKFMSEFEKEHGYSPDVDKIVTGTGMTLARVAEAQEVLAYEFPSLNFHVGDKESDQFADLVIDGNEGTMVDMALGTTYVMDTIMERAFVSDHDKTCAAIVILSLGLPFNPAFVSSQFAIAHNLQEGRQYETSELAKLFGVSRKTIDNRRDKALQVLARPEHVQELLEGME